MKASKFSDAQKAFIIKQGEEGTTPATRRPQDCSGRGEQIVEHQARTAAGVAGRTF